MDSYGKPECKDSVWNKGKRIRGCDSNEWRKDIYGNKINYHEHGKLTEYGWEIDHYIPKAKCGSDDISNLHPLHYKQNRGMGMRMNTKDKLLWFHLLEQKYEIPKEEKIKIKIGEIALVKQSPKTESQLAMIRDIDRKNKKVKIFWIYGKYEEVIELYYPLFSSLPTKRIRNK
jgi:hypothetical protein